LLRGTLTVEETNIRDAKGRPVVGQPKSRAAERTISLPAALVSLLAAHLADAGLTAADGAQLIFQAPQGGPLRYSNWRRRVWIAAVTTAGFTGNGRSAKTAEIPGFHDLRRANATELVAAGVDIKTAQFRLGHSDPRLTLAIYASATSAADRAAANERGDCFPGPSRTNRARPTAN
jgi:integrase